MRRGVRGEVGPSSCRQKTGGEGEGQIQGRRNAKQGAFSYRCILCERQHAPSNKLSICVVHRPTVSKMSRLYIIQYDGRTRGHFELQYLCYFLCQYR